MPTIASRIELRLMNANVFVFERPTRETHRMLVGDPVNRSQLFPSHIAEFSTSPAQHLHQEGAGKPKTSLQNAYPRAAEMAKRCLGEPWTELNDDERQEFVDLFVQVLRDALANRIFEYSNDRIIYLSEQRERDRAKVVTRLSGSKADTLVEFRLTNKSGQWFLYDAVIDGASMVAPSRLNQVGAVLNGHRFD